MDRIDAAMTPQTVQQKVADTGAVIGWSGWFLSHLDQINGILQFLLLIASIAATVVAARYHWKKSK